MHKHIYIFQEIVRGTARARWAGRASVKPRLGAQIASRLFVPTTVSAYVCICTYKYVNMYIYIYIYSYIHIHIYVYAYILINTYVHIYIPIAPRHVVSRNVSVLLLYFSRSPSDACVGALFLANSRVLFLSLLFSLSFSPSSLSCARSLLLLLLLWLPLSLLPLLSLFLWLMLTLPPSLAISLSCALSLSLPLCPTPPALTSPPNKKH